MSKSVSFHSGRGPSSHGKLMPGVTKNGDKGKNPVGSSSKKSLDGSPPGIKLAELHSAGKTHETFQAARLAKLASRGK